jgi:ER-bound oxygenase mpaB/B'/Rubber oxygenase, catalytic domain
VAPTEFRYWENEGRGWARVVRAAGRLVGFDPAPPREVVASVAAMYEDGDPLADAFLDEVRSAKDARAMFHKAARDGIASVPHAPKTLRALFADVETPPAWLDREEVERGARVFRRYGSSVFRFAGAITLAGYSESSVAKPLAMTGGYVGGSARRRFLETAAFWIDVSEPKGLVCGAPGWVTTLHVRLGHAFVRRRLLGHPAWNRAAWGVPINQADSFFTLMGGSIGPGLAMRAMGFRTSRKDIEALLHFWRWVGHIVGVKPQWYPTTPGDALKLAFVALSRGANLAGEDGRMLCQSYANAFAPDPSLPLAEWMRAQLSHRVHLGYTRFFLPPWIYQRNALPSAGLWALHPIAQMPFVFTLESLRRASTTIDDVLDASRRRTRRAWLDRHMRSNGRPNTRSSR